MAVMITVECPHGKGRKEVDSSSMACEDSKNCNHDRCKHNNSDIGRKKERPGVIFY